MLTDREFKIPTTEACKIYIYVSVKIEVLSLEGTEYSLLLFQNYGRVSLYTLDLLPTWNSFIGVLVWKTIELV